MARVVSVRHGEEVGVKRTVKMVRAADVVSRDNGDESSGAISAGGLHTAKRISLDSGSRTVAIALRLNTRVDTGGVTSPHLDIGISDRLAR